MTGRRANADFSTFFEAEYERLFQAMYLMCGNKSDAEDLAQEAMARAFERLDRSRLSSRPSVTSSRSPSTCTEAGFGGLNGGSGAAELARAPRTTSARHGLRCSRRSPRSPAPSGRRLSLWSGSGSRPTRPAESLGSTPHLSGGAATVRGTRFDSDSET